MNDFIGYDLQWFLTAVMPYLTGGVLAVVWMFLEITHFREMAVDHEVETGRNGFLPPDSGYEYPVGNSAYVWIQQMSRNHFRVYPIAGAAPNQWLHRSKYGSYFNIRAGDFGTAEKIIDRLYTGVTN